MNKKWAACLHAQTGSPLPPPLGLRITISVIADQPTFVPKPVFRLEIGVRDTARRGNNDQPQQYRVIIRVNKECHDEHGPGDIV